MRIKWGPRQMLPTFDSTVTLLNKLSGSDSKTGLDVWKKTILHNCAWSGQLQRSVSDNTVFFGSSFVVRVPKSENYHPYNEWAMDMDGFTFSTGDYLIKGEIVEDVTPENVVSVVESYRPNACIIKIFKDNSDNFGVLEHYRLEGV